MPTSVVVYSLGTALGGVWDGVLFLCPRYPLSSACAFSGGDMLFAGVGAMAWIWYGMDTENRGCGGESRCKKHVFMKFLNMMCRRAM